MAKEAEGLAFEVDPVPEKTFVTMVGALRHKSEPESKAATLATRVPVQSIQSTCKVVGTTSYTTEEVDSVSPMQTVFNRPWSARRKRDSFKHQNRTTWGTISPMRGFALWRSGFSERKGEWS